MYFKQIFDERCGYTSYFVTLGSLAVMTALVFGLMLAATPAHAATTFTVDSTRDEGDVVSGDGVCDSDPRSFAVRCTLRAAIEEANATGGTDTIDFGIDGSGVKTIRPATRLPAINDSVTIDGYSQPGARPNSQNFGTNAILKIELDGTNAGAGANGLHIQASKTVIKGLVINRFPVGGIYVIRATSIAIQGNFIGTDPGGTLDLGNRYYGVFVTGPVTGPANTTIGGTTPAARNLISGNGGAGIEVGRSTTIAGNFIGTDKNGTGNLGNSENGLRIGASNVSVGGTDPGAANTIAFNELDGVQVASGTGNSILRNSIFSNGRLGIDLRENATNNLAGPTANDPGDADTGANNLQNFPVLTSATTSGDITTIRGTLNSAPSTTFTIQFFRNPAGTDEGKRFIGQKRNVSTDASGDATFTFRPTQRVNARLAITATATDPGGNTSEFSDPETVG